MKFNREISIDICILNHRNPRRITNLKDIKAIMIANYSNVYIKYGLWNPKANYSFLRPKWYVVEDQSLDFFRFKDLYLKRFEHDQIASGYILIRIYE